MTSVWFPYRLVQATLSPIQGRLVRVLLVLLVVCLRQHGTHGTFRCLPLVHSMSRSQRSCWHVAGAMQLCASLLRRQTSAVLLLLLGIA